MADEIDVLSRELENVRLEFERFFMGIEKRPPYQRRDQIARKIRRFRPERNAVHRFKHQNLIQRLISLEQYWGRIQRGIEAGTLNREVAKADFRQAFRNKEDAPSGGQAPSTPQKQSPAQGQNRAVAKAADDFLNKISGTADTDKPRVGMRGKTRRKDG